MLRKRQKAKIKSYKEEGRRREEINAQNYENMGECFMAVIRGCKSC
jgi:hypothetical protein